MFYNFKIPRLNVVRSIIVCAIVAIQMAGLVFAESSAEVTPESTQFYREMRALTKKIDDVLEKIRNMVDREKSAEEYRLLLEKNNLAIVHEAELSYVYRYSGPLLDLLDVPSIAESINDKKLKKCIILKRALDIADFEKDELGFCLSINHPNILKTYFGYRAEPLESYEKLNTKIVWLFQENMEIPISDPKSNVVMKHIFDDRRRIIKDIATGLAHLHKQNILHLDIKTENAMGTYSKKEERIVYKIIDLGMTMKIEEGKKFKTIPGKGFGTDPFRAPELYFNSEHGYAADIWSLAHFVLRLKNMKINPNYEILRYRKGDDGKYLDDDKMKYPMIEPLNGYHKFLKGKMEFIITPDLPLVLADFLKKCTSRDPAKRCSSEDLLAHPYLQGIAVSANPSAETMNKMYTF